MQALPWAWKITSLDTVALRVMILPLPLSTDAVNGIPSPMQNPILGTLTVRDIGGEAQHRQQLNWNHQCWYVDVNSVDDLDNY